MCFFQQPARAISYDLARIVDPSGIRAGRTSTGEIKRSKTSRAQQIGVTVVCSYDVACIVDPLGRRGLGARGINSTETARAQQKTMKRGPAAAAVISYNVACVVDCSRAGTEIAGNIDGDKATSAKQITMTEGITIEEFPHNLARVVDPICIGSKSARIVNWSKRIIICGVSGS